MIRAIILLFLIFRNVVAMDEEEKQKNIFFNSFLLEFEGNINNKNYTEDISDEKINKVVVHITKTWVDSTKRSLRLVAIEKNIIFETLKILRTLPGKQCDHCKHVFKNNISNNRSHLLHHLSKQDREVLCNGVGGSYLSLNTQGQGELDCLCGHKNMNRKYRVKKFSKDEVFRALKKNEKEDLETCPFNDCKADFKKLFYRLRKHMHICRHFSQEDAVLYLFDNSHSQQLNELGLQELKNY